MFSYAKAVKREEVARIRREFEVVYNERGKPAHMWLAQVDHPEPNYTYLVWISDKRPARALALGFEMEWAPRKADLVVGNEASFEKHLNHKAHAA
jgi:hypothetical protein